MSETITYKFEVRVVMLLENDTWIAQGLDYDITGHGRTTDAALDNFGQTLLGQAIVDIHHGLEPLSNTPKAPEFYWKRFDEEGWRKEKRFAVRERRTVPEETPPAFMISAIATASRIDA